MVAMGNEKQKQMSLSEMIQFSRPKEIAIISEALRKNENVLITGRFFTGKTMLADEISNMADAGKIWDGEIVSCAYVHAKDFIEGGSTSEKELSYIEGLKSAVLVIDEIGDEIDDLGGLEDFLKIVKKFNLKGVVVIVVGGGIENQIDSLKPMFPVVINLQTPPSTMSESMVWEYKDANGLFDEGDV